MFLFCFCCILSINLKSANFFIFWKKFQNSSLFCDIHGTEPANYRNHKKALRHLWVGFYGQQSNQRCFHKCNIEAELSELAFSTLATVPFCKAPHLHGRHFRTVLSVCNVSGSNCVHPMQKQNNTESYKSFLSLLPFQSIKGMNAYIMQSRS